MSPPRFTIPRVARLARSLPLSVALLLTGCRLVLLDPAGDVARQQSDIMITTTLIMALIIVPVLVAIGVVAWRYRASAQAREYDAQWDHSPQLELLVWAVPLLVVMAIGAVSWVGTHRTDPYSKLHRLAVDQGVPADVKPLEVDVVSMRWKWLFFYPQYGIATVNELAAPVNRPIAFKLTSSDMMDAFFVPDLAGMIYTMPGMQTQLHAVINKPGEYKGMSANYSGAGFTDMRFRFHGLAPADFGQWVGKVRDSGHALDLQAYGQLHQPSRAEPVHYYASFASGLYRRILERCVQPGTPCMGSKMAMTMPAGTHLAPDGQGQHGPAAAARIPLHATAAPAAAMH